MGKKKGVLDQNEIYSALVQGSPDFLLVIDPLWKIVYLNLAGPQGEPEFYLGKNALDFVAKKHRKRVEDIYKKVIKTGQKENYECMDTENLWYDCCAGPILKGKKVVGISIVARDVTQKKEKQNRYQILFDLSPDAVLLVRAKDASVHAANREASNLLGYPESEIVKLSGMEIVSQDIRNDPDHEHHSWASQVKEKGCFMVNTLWVHKDGQNIPVVVRGKPMILGGEEFYYLIAHDDRERERMKQQMKDTQELLDTIFENIPDMIFVKEAKELRFVKFNKAGEDLLGFPRADMLGKNDYDFFPREQADFFTRKDREVLQDGNVVDIPQEPIQTNLKGKRWLHTKKVPLYDEKGRPKFLLGISEDITEKKVLAEEKEKLQRELAKYATSLETKVRKLEKQRVNLNARERAVLYALTVNPMSSDKEIATSTGLKRSTVTAIRNRLLQGRWFKKVNIPNIRSLGIEVISIITAELIEGVSKEILEETLLELKKNPQCFCAVTSDSMIAMAFAYTNLASSQRAFQELLQKFQVEKIFPDLHHNLFVVETTELPKFFNFAPLLEYHFSYPPSSPIIDIPITKTTLSTNEKELLFLLSRYPSASNARLKELSRLSKPTIIRIRKRLFSEGFLLPVIVPNLSKLGLKSVGICFENRNLFENKKFITKIASEPNTFLSLVNNSQYFFAFLFSDQIGVEQFSLYTKDRIQDLFKTLQVPSFFSGNNLRFVKLSFSQLIKECFDLDS